MKILFVARAFVGMAGGAEHMTIKLMNAVASRGHDVHLLTWDLPGAGTAFFAMDPRITWHKIGCGDPTRKAGFVTRLARMFRVRRVLSRVRPDLGVGIQHGPFWAARLYGLGMGVPWICAERNAPGRMNFAYLRENKNFVFQTMRLARAVTIQCESYRRDYPAFLQSRLAVIPNPVQTTPVRADVLGAPMGRKKLLSVGRLAPQKNYACLIRAFFRLAPDHLQWDLEIIGDGDERADLTALIDYFGLHGRVTMPGTVPPDQMAGAYASAQLFVLPSRFEGFPNALAESLAHGLPAVGFADCPGVRDLIVPEVNGLLADGMDDPETLAEALATLMRDDVLRARLAAQAPTSVAAYTPDKIFDRWEELFIQTAKGRP